MALACVTCEANRRYTSECRRFIIIGMVAGNADGTNKHPGCVAYQHAPGGWNERATGRMSCISTTNGKKASV